MSMHKKPLTRLEEDGLRAHGLFIGTPSQLSDAFRQGVAWALAQPAAECNHRFMYFGDQKRRRCADCNTVEPEQQPVAECTNEDSWNCKYCRKTAECSALNDPLNDPRNFGAPQRPAEDDGLFPDGRKGQPAIPEWAKRVFDMRGQLVAISKAITIGDHLWAQQLLRTAIKFAPTEAVQQRPEVHLNAADKLPPVDCPLLIEVMKGYLVLAQRTGIIENKRADMEYRLVTGETIQGRFRWTYP